MEQGMGKGSFRGGILNRVVTDKVTFEPQS